MRLRDCLTGDAEERGQALGMVACVKAWFFDAGYRAVAVGVPAKSIVPDGQK